MASVAIGDSRPVGIEAAAPAQPAATPFRLAAILVPLAAIILGAFMAMLDGTAVNVALPVLVDRFHSDVSTLQWAITGYSLAQAAIIPLAGWLCDRFDARRVYLAALGAFVAGSLLCACALNPGMLIGFRVLQGLGGGCLLPIGMTYIFKLSPPEKRGVVMGTYGIPILFAPAIGPTLSGFLVQYADWRFVFLLNLPIGALALWLGLRFLPSLERQATVALDRAGMLLGPLSFALLTFGVTQTGSGWSSPPALAGLGLGLATLAGFVAAELRAEQPLLDLRVFRSLDFTLALLTQWIGQVALFGGVFLVPLFLHIVRHYGALDTGLALLPQALAAALFMPVGGIIYDRYGVRPVVIGGLTLVGIATLALARIGNATEARDLILPLALRGAGMGVMMMPLNTHLLAAAPRALVGKVSALSQSLSNVIAAMTIAAMATLLQSRANEHIDTMINTFDARMSSNQGLPPGIGDTLKDYGAAWAQGFDETFLFQSGFAVAGVLMALSLRRLATPSAPKPGTA